MAHNMVRGGVCGRPDGHNGSHRSLAHTASRRVYNREWSKQHPWKYRPKPSQGPGYWRAKSLKQKYNLTVDEWDTLLASQDGKCAICRGVPTRQAGWNTDHDHISGANRGILCGPCNLGLGNFQDDPALLKAAIAYLRKPPAASLFGGRSR